MLVCFSAARHRSELLAKAIIAEEVRMKICALKDEKSLRKQRMATYDDTRHWGAVRTPSWSSTAPISILSPLGFMRCSLTSADRADEQRIFAAAAHTLRLGGRSNLQLVFYFKPAN